MTLDEIVADAKQRAMWASETSSSYSELGDKYGAAWFAGRMEGILYVVAMIEEWGVANTMFVEPMTLDQIKAQYGSADSQ